MLVPNEINADLHSHSRYSDGTLTPRALVERAQAQGVELFALTDHDETGGIADIQAAADVLKPKGRLALIHRADAHGGALGLLRRPDPQCLPGAVCR